jgi:hypothetical protein
LLIYNDSPKLKKVASIIPGDQKLISFFYISIFPQFKIIPAGFEKRGFIQYEKGFFYMRNYKYRPAFFTGEGYGIFFLGSVG